MNLWKQQSRNGQPGRGAKSGAAVSLIRLFMVSLLVNILSCQPRNDVTVVKLAHALDIHHPVHQAIEYMAERAVLHSKGQLRVDIYPGGQLGNERELMELLQIGSLGMTKVSSSPMESFVPAMQIFSIPYVFRDNDHFWQVLNSEIGQTLLLAGEHVRLRGLGYYDAGSRSFYTVNKPIRTPADLAGVKVRVQPSPTSIKMVRSMGGSATPVSWGELYTALQQGVVDGAENNPPSFYSSHHYEVARYYTLNEHTMVPDILIVSQHVWQNLDPQQQAWLQLAVDESVVYQRELWKAASEEALRIVSEAGVEIIVPDKAPFMELVRPMQEALRGTPAYEILEQIRAMPPAQEPANI